MRRRVGYSRKTFPAPPVVHLLRPSSRVLSGPGFELLREVPLMPFRILGAIAPVAVKRVFRLFKDLSARLLGAFKMLVHIVDIDVEALCRVAEPLRIPILRARISHHDEVIAEFHGAT